MPVSDPRDNHATFERCWNDGDVDGLLALYEEDAIYVPVAGETLAGHAAIRAMLEGVAQSGMRNRLELVNLVELGDIALERTRWTITMPDGSETSGNSTVVLRRQADGSWRMAIDDPGLVP